MYDYEAWFKAEPRDTTWTVICNFYRDLLKKVTVSQVDREEYAVCLLPSSSAQCSSNAVSSIKPGVSRSLSRQASSQPEPLIFLTSYYFQTRKGNSCNQAFSLGKFPFAIFDHLESIRRFFYPKMILRESLFIN